jgi:pimeloyl-ACP methyl ester carboxylesterase
MIKLMCCIAVFLSAAGIASATPCDHPDNLRFVTGGRECLVIRTYRGGAVGVGPVLFVVLHGDYSHNAFTGNQYATAERLTEVVPNAVAVGLTRPGYMDRAGLSSTGDSFGHHDNETAENIDDIADAIATLKKMYQPRKVVLVGHSGGATVASVILGRQPRLADGAVLVSSPCDLVAWHAAHNSHKPFRSESPDRYVDRIPLGARVAVLVGSADTNTFPFLSERYVAALKARGVPVTLTEIPGADHDAAFVSPVVYAAAAELAK